MTTKNILITIAVLAGAYGVYMLAKKYTVVTETSDPRPNLSGGRVVSHTVTQAADEQRHS